MTGFALATAALHKLLSPILPGFDLNTLALLIGPFTGANTALAVYWLTQEVRNDNRDLVRLHECDENQSVYLLDSI